MRRAVRAVWAAGFTLSEMLIVIAILSILTALSIPTFRSLAAQNQLATAGNQMRSAALVARSAAISLNRRVTFCAGQANVGCHGDWARNEWLVFEDRDRDGTVDVGETSHLVDHARPSENLAVSANGPFNNRVVFTPTGMAVTASGAFAAGRIRLCTELGGAGEVLDLVLIGSGRLESERRTLADGCLPL